MINPGEVGRWLDTISSVGATANEENIIFRATAETRSIRRERKLAASDKSRQSGAMAPRTSPVGASARGEKVVPEEQQLNTKDKSG